MLEVDGAVEVFLGGEDVELVVGGRRGRASGADGDVCGAAAAERECVTAGKVEREGGLPETLLLRILLPCAERDRRHICRSSPKKKNNGEVETSGKRFGRERVGGREIGVLPWMEGWRMKRGANEEGKRCNFF